MATSREWTVLMVAACIVVVISTAGFVEGATDASCAAVLCLENTFCRNGKCYPICPSGTADCNGDLQDRCEVNVKDGDVDNCSRCGRRCADPQSYEFVNCVGGKCVYTDRCTAIKCATYPNAETTCRKGQCRVKCLPGFADCDGVLEVGSNGCEVNLQTDAKNCGRCGRKCAGTCRNGRCEKECN